MVAAPSRTPERRQLRVLVVFVLGFVLLLVGYLMLNPDAPTAPSAAAIVNGADDHTVAITNTELARAVERKAEKSLRKVPQRGDEHLEDLQAEVLGESLEEIWYSEEAQALGISVTYKELAAELARIKAKKYPTEASYERHLEESRLTPQDFERRIRHRLLSAKVREQETAYGLAGKDRFAAEFLFESEFAEKWKARTKCAPAFLNMKGSGGIDGAGYIIEQVCPGASSGGAALEESLPGLRLPGADGQPR